MTNWDFKTWIRKPRSQMLVVFGVVNIGFIYWLTSYFSRIAVINAKNYYAKGGNMKVSMPEELQDEFIDQTIRNRRYSKPSDPKRDQQKSSYEMVQ